MRANCTAIQGFIGPWGAACATQHAVKVSIRGERTMLRGGLCSVNLAAGMIYTIGGTFWEFGGPDLERARLFVMIGTAEDHHSNPMKAALAAFRRAGGRFIAINPVRTGYAAIADEWVPIKPGTDGALLLALMHEIIAHGLYDHDFVARYTNAGQLVNQDPASDGFGLLLREPADGNLAPASPRGLWWDRLGGRPVADHSEGADPELLGRFRMPDGTPVVPAFQLLVDRVAPHTPEWAAAITGIDADTIRRLAHEIGSTARAQQFELPIAWTDSWGTRHASVTGRPVAFHAMRGLAAHSNGFHAARALACLMSLLGTIDRPGGFRHKAPYPHSVPPAVRLPNGPEAVQPDTPLGAAPLGWPEGPDDLFVDAAGEPVRIDKGFSWEHPLSAHGLMHNVITNAWRGADGSKSLRGEPNPRQWDMYARHGGVFRHEMPPSLQYMRNCNDGYMRWAQEAGLRRGRDPVVIQLYSEILQRFRLAAQGKHPGRQPPERWRRRVQTYCDPLPMWYPPLEAAATDTARYPLNAVTQRPMAMYHSWDSQNAWLRPIHDQNCLFVNTKTALAAGIADGAWIWVESPWGRVRCQCRHSEAVEPGTVWTWNAIGKARGAWALDADAHESQRGFLLNHLITEELPCAGGKTVSNSDPVTGQAAWYDVRVRIEPAAAQEPARSWPQFEAPVRLWPGMAPAPKRRTWMARLFPGRAAGA